MRAAQRARAAGALVAGALGYGAASRRAASGRETARRAVRVAAVVADGAPPAGAPVPAMWPRASPEYRDVARTLARYAGHVERAAQANAKVRVLPDACVVIGDDSRVAWERGLAEWATRFSLTVVAGYFDAATLSKELCIVEPGG